MEAVVAASAVPNIAFKWMLEIEAPDTTYESLENTSLVIDENTRIDFDTLDAKLATFDGDYAQPLFEHNHRTKACSHEAGKIGQGQANHAPC